MNIREFFRAPFSSAAPDSRPHKTAARADTHLVSPEITVYRRQRSAVWQCRFKLSDGRWHRLSTGCVDLDQARIAAIKLAEQWSVRAELGLPIKRPSFSVVARAVIKEIQTTQSNGLGKVVYKDYIAVLERYLIPFFGRLMFEDISPEVIADFDTWRNTRIGRIPRASTMRTHASAFNRVLDAAKARGLLPLATGDQCQRVPRGSSGRAVLFDTKSVVKLLL